MPKKEREPMQAPDPVAEFAASVAKVQTMADGSPRFVLDAPEAAIGLLSKLGQAQANGQYLHVIAFDADEWMEYLRTQTSQS